MRSQSNTRRTPLLASQPLAQARSLRLVTILLLLLTASARAQIPVQATTIPLILPSFLTYDSAGNLYFSETKANVIRKVDPNGFITTVAGTGTQGFSGDQGLATAALLDSPSGIALDAAGNLYIADSHNQRIRRVSLSNPDSATHIISTIVGTGSQGFAGDAGPANAATLNLPTALALDPAGNLYFADSNNHRIREVTTAGQASSTTILTIAGTGTQGFTGDHGLALAADLDAPTGITLDSSGNLYLADTHNHRIRRISLSDPDPATHIITTIAGNGTPGLSGDLGPATAATLDLPHGLTIDVVGNVYIADTRNHRIRRIDSITGVITTVAGDLTQAFAGDTHPAPTASLDSPLAVTLSPNSSITLTDTGNQRVRQINPVNDIITTVAGLGISTPGMLTLSAPSVIAYGTGTLTATLSSSTLATGSITFFDTSAATRILATADLKANTATFSTTHLPAGPHYLTANYPGDPAHTPAFSDTLLITVAPATLTATPDAVKLLYGQPIPPLTGTLAGLLMQDFTFVSPDFTTTAPRNLAPAATYPITATISGPAAADYSLISTPAVLTIAQAPSVTLLNASAVGSTLTLTAQTLTTTSGTPTGAITILDGKSLLTSIPIPVNGNAFRYTTTALALGAHTITAVYPGDANFLASASSPALEVIGTPADFTLTSTGQISLHTQAGAAASFTFDIQILGNSLSSPINLAASGLPLGATASFDPLYIPPGGAVSAVTLTVQTIPHARLTPPPNFYRSLPSIALALLLLPTALLQARRRLRLPAFAWLALISFVLLSSAACGNRTNTAADTPASKTYAITVSGTATSPTGTVLQHSATVTLIVL